jgi:hypothetical protein
MECDAIPHQVLPTVRTLFPAPDYKYVDDDDYNNELMKN